LLKYFPAFPLPAAFRRKTGQKRGIKNNEKKKLFSPVFLTFPKEFCIMGTAAGQAAS
jgi:hypothetical protein